MKQIIDSFNHCNPDYPLTVANLHIEVCHVSDTDIPFGNGGINGERYTYKQLCHQPIIPELMRGVRNAQLKRDAEECNARNLAEGFRMFKVEGEYCFWGLKIEPVVKTPTVSEIRRILLNNPKTEKAAKSREVTAELIRGVTYGLLRNEVASRCGMSEKEAALAIGNQLDCAPHEDLSGYIFMVPNWAHKWFRHDGYVSKMLQEVNF